MAVLNVLIGIPGSGKTTFVQKFLKENDCVLVSTDLVRLNNPGILEDLVWPKVYEEIGTNLAQGNDVVFDATSISPKVRDRLKENVNKYCNNYQLNAYYLSFCIPFRKYITSIYILFATSIISSTETF